MAKGETIRAQPESDRREPASDVLVGDLEAPLLLEDFAPDFADDLPSLVDAQSNAPVDQEAGPVLDVAAEEKPEAVLVLETAEADVAAADGGSESDISFLIAMALDRGDTGAAEVLSAQPTTNVEGSVDAAANGHAPTTEVLEQEPPRDSSDEQAVASATDEQPVASATDEQPVASATDTEEISEAAQAVPAVDGFLATVFTAPATEAPPATDAESEQETTPVASVGAKTRVLPERVPDKAPTRGRPRLLTPLIGVGLLLTLVMSALAGVAAVRFRAGDASVAVDAPIVTSGTGATAGLPASNEAPKANCHSKDAGCSSGKHSTTGVAAVPQTISLGSTTPAQPPAARKHHARHHHHRKTGSGGSTEPGSGGGPGPQPTPEEPTAEQNCGVGEAQGWAQHPEKQHGHDHFDCPTKPSQVV